MSALVAGETKQSSPAQPTPPTNFLDLFDKVLFRSTSAAITSTASDPNPEIYQINVDSTAPSASSSSSTPLTTFQIYRFYTDDSDQDSNNNEPLCGGTVQVNTMAIGQQCWTTIMLTGNLTAIGMEECACGTVHTRHEQIQWSNGSCWEVHARVVEDSLESFVGLNVTNVDLLTPSQMKLQMLFSEFDKNCDGLLCYEEFLALDAATEEDPQVMTEESFQNIVRIVHSVREDQVHETGGLDILDLTCIYVGPIAEMFETDLNSDFAAVFQEEAKVAFIFDCFDMDEDGFWSPEEEAQYVAATGRDSNALEWFRNDDGTTCVSISSLLPMYLTEATTSDVLEADFQVAGELVGFGREEE